MKKLILLTLFLSGIFTVPLTATTFRVNNKLTDNATLKIYSTLSKAQDAANNGDTIMLEGSPDPYSDFQCTKRLIIKGPGYFLGENPGISANKLYAVINQINFSEGSLGSVLIGVTLNNVAIYTGGNNITFRRCCIANSVYQTNCENIALSECYFLGSSQNIVVPNSFYALTNLVVMNCIFNGSIFIIGSSTGVFINNVFNLNYITIPNGFVMKNNILFTTEKTNIDLPDLNSFISYNISISDHFGTANNNKANVTASSLFVGTGSSDGKWQLKAGSPAIGAGEGGIDCGAFGGLGPYILSGVPTGPVIYQLNVSSHSISGNKLPVTIKVKSY
jgi:hypothetical protein